MPLGQKRDDVGAQVVTSAAVFGLRVAEADHQQVGRCARAGAEQLLSLLGRSLAGLLAAAFGGRGLALGSRRTFLALGDLLAFGDLGLGEFLGGRGLAD